MSNKIKYKPTKKFIGIETGFVQAATLLDIAAVSAIGSNDRALLVDIAAQWIDLSRAMTEALAPKQKGDDEDDDEDHGSRHDGAPVGFGVTAQEIKDYHDRRTNKS